MSWEWSHTDIALRAVEANIKQKPRDWLEVVYAEWMGDDGDDRLNEERYEAALQEAKGKEPHDLAKFIWDKANDHRRCENGGHEAFCCPFHCGCHTVKFCYEPSDDLQLLLNAEVDDKPTLANLLNYAQNLDPDTALEVFGGDNKARAMMTKEIVTSELQAAIEILGELYVIEDE